MRISNVPPASLVSIRSHNDAVISEEVSEWSRVSLASITVKMEDNRNFLASGRGRDSNLGGPGREKIIKYFDQKQRNKMNV